MKFLPYMAIFPLCSPSSAAEDLRIYDENWNLKYGVEDVCIYDRNWNQKEHIRKTGISKG